MIELAIEVGGEIVGFFAERRTEKKKESKKKGSDPVEPWEKEIDKLAWEE